MEPRNLPKPNRAWNLGTFQTCTWNPCICGPPGSFTCNLEPRNFTWNPYWKPSKLLGPYLESLLGALEPSETLLKNLCWEPRPSLGTFQNLYSYLDGTYMLYLEPRNPPEPLLGTLAQNLGTFWNPLWLEPLLGTSEPAGTFTWNPYYTWNLGTFLLGTLTWNLGTCRNLYLEPLYLEPRNLRNLTWNPYLEPRNLPEPLLGTLTQNLGTCRNLYLEPWLGTSKPAGTFTWNLGTCRNLYLEPLLGTSEPARTWRDDCPRVPQGLVWLGPQSFQLLGKYDRIISMKWRVQHPSNILKEISPVNFKKNKKNPNKMQNCFSQYNCQIQLPNRISQ